MADVNLLRVKHAWGPGTLVELAKLATDATRWALLDRPTTPERQTAEELGGPRGGWWTSGVLIVGTLAQCRCGLGVGVAASSSSSSSGVISRGHCKHLNDARCIPSAPAHAHHVITWNWLHLH